MTQVFADDDQVADPGMLTRVVHLPIPIQQTSPRPVPWTGGQPGPAWLGPAMMPGKGVRRIRCVGCAHETLPRNDDQAPLCQRCSDLLATADTEIDSLAPALIHRGPRWLRRRSTLD
jgi:hypothetical protein